MEGKPARVEVQGALSRSKGDLNKRPLNDIVQADVVLKKMPLEVDDRDRVGKDVVEFAEISLEVDDRVGRDVVAGAVVEEFVRVVVVEDPDDTVEVIEVATPLLDVPLTHEEAGKIAS